MEGTELEEILIGAGLNGMRLRSSTILKMFKTNEYAFQACKTDIDDLKRSNLRHFPTVTNKNVLLSNDILMPTDANCEEVEAKKGEFRVDELNVQLDNTTEESELSIRAVVDFDEFVSDI